MFLALFSHGVNVLDTDSSRSSVKSVISFRSCKRWRARTPPRKVAWSSGSEGVGPLAVSASETQSRFSRYSRKTVEIGQVVLDRWAAPSNEIGEKSLRVNSSSSSGV